MIRIKLEALESELRTLPMKVFHLKDPIDLKLDQRYHASIRQNMSILVNWGISFDADLHLASFPEVFRERVLANPKGFREIITSHVQKLEEGTLEFTMPSGYQDWLNSIACRSAIMFGDTLTREQCRDLVEKLKKCKFPFQCGKFIWSDILAHGRPSMVPLLNLLITDADCANRKDKSRSLE